MSHVNIWTTHAKKEQFATQFVGHSIFGARDPQLRDLWHLLGVPNLNERQQKQVDECTQLMVWAVQFAGCFMDAGAYWSIGNPMPSWLWCMAPARALWRRCGSMLFLVTYQAWGTPWYKLTGFFTNIPGLWRMDLGDTTSKAAVQLRGTFWWKGIQVMCTSVAAEYPAAMSNKYAELVDVALTSRQLAIEDGAPVPMADKSNDCGVMAGELPWEVAPGVVPAQGLMARQFVTRGAGCPEGCSEEGHIASDLHRALFQSVVPYVWPCCQFSNSTFQTLSCTT
jgi:hypothetical protein